MRRGSQTRDAVLSIEEAGGWVFYDDSFIDGRVREPTALETCIDNVFGRQYRSTVTIAGVPAFSMGEPELQNKIESLPGLSTLVVSCRQGFQRQWEDRLTRRFPHLNIEVREDLIELGD
jgi:hypothetical protein